MEYSVVRLRFHHNPVPYFIGSQIRGAMGYALKKIVCINSSMQCEGCFAKENCLYYDWYERQGGYHSYRLDIDLGKSYYDFGLYLFGEGVAKLPYVVSALDRMLRIHGLGKERHKIDRYELFIDGVEAKDRSGRIVLPQTTPARLEISNVQRVPLRIKVRFLTPLRIKYGNRFVRNISNLPLHTLIASIDARLKRLQGKEPSKLAHRVEGEIVDRFGTFKDLTRYSGRQKGHLKIGGLLGELAVEGADAQSYALLKAAELIGAGKQTVFGLGKIKVEELDTI